jgi:predicted transcriptional regulator
MKKKHEEIRTEYMDLLILILRGCNTSTKIAKKLKINRTTAANRLRVLEQKNFISKNIIYNSRPFELTSKGQNLTTFFMNTLKGNSELPKGRLKAHKITWVMDITKKPCEILDLLKKKAFVPSKHNTWYKYTKRHEDIKIVFNPNKVFIYIDGFYINNPLEYYDTAVEKVRKAKKYLEEQFKGLTLGDPLKQMVAASNHIVKQYGPLAMKFYEASIKAGKPIVYHGKKLNVDFSDGPPEEETVDPVTAPMDMHNLGEFFENWLEDPIQISELHATKDNLDKVKSEIKTKLEKGDNDFKQIISRLQGSYKKIEKVQNNQKEIFDVASNSFKINEELKDKLLNSENNQKEILQVAIRAVQGNDELKGYLAKFFLSQEVFSTAMHEHVALIKTLQVLAQKNKEGLENGLKDMTTIMTTGLQHIMIFFKDFVKLNSEEQSKREVRLINDLGEKHTKEMRLIADLVTPWYMRIYNFFNKKLSKR